MFTGMIGELDAIPDWVWRSLGCSMLASLFYNNRTTIIKNILK